MDPRHEAGDDTGKGWSEPVVATHAPCGSSMHWPSGGHPHWKAVLTCHPGFARPRLRTHKLRGASLAQNRQLAMDYRDLRQTLRATFSLHLAGFSPLEIASAIPCGRIASDISRKCRWHPRPLWVLSLASAFFLLHFAAGGPHMRIVGPFGLGAFPLFGAVSDLPGTL